MDKTIFIKAGIMVWKIVVACVLFYFTIGLFFSKTLAEYVFGFCLLIFITLPTVFAIFFKKKFIENHPSFTKPWNFMRVILAISWVIFACIILFSLYVLDTRTKTQSAIDFINSKKITLDDVMGKNLPNWPDMAANDSTIAGVDTNNNYIRDDVEKAIFTKYPNSAKIRAAELQYAQALQLELTKVFNSETLVAAIKKENSASFCLADSWPTKDITAINGEDEKVKNLVLSTSSRKSTRLDLINKYTKGYALPSGDTCDLKVASLPN